MKTFELAGTEHDPAKFGITDTSTLPTDILTIDKCALLYQYPYAPGPSGSKTIIYVPKREPRANI